MHAFCYIMQLAGFSSRRRQGSRHLYPSIPLTTTTHLDCAPTLSPPSQVSLSGCLHSARVIAGSAISQSRAPVHLQEASAAVCATLHMVQAAPWQRRLQPVPSLLQPGLAQLGKATTAPTQLSWAKIAAISSATHDQQPPASLASSCHPASTVSLGSSRSGMGWGKRL